MDVKTIMGSFIIQNEEAANWVDHVFCVKSHPTIILGIFRIYFHVLLTPVESM